MFGLHTGINIYERVEFLFILVQENRPDKIKPLETLFDLGEIKSWSYSGLKVFEQCPFRSYLARVSGIV